MPLTKTFNQPTVVICHNDNDTIHVVNIDEPPASIGTGQPHMEEFPDMLSAIARVQELGGDVHKLTNMYWPEGKIPTEQGGQLVWTDAPEESLEPA